jgi:23S rRNA (cytosine1962-C5)-methyltransferase
VTEPTLHLRAGRERSLRRHHPWIFGGAVARVQGNPAPGSTVLVRDDRGEVLGRAAYSPSSQIVGRMWTFDADERVDDAFVAARVTASADRRRPLGARTDAARLVFSESDGFPGLIVDRYGSVAVCQLLSAGADRWRSVVAEALASIEGVEAVVERSEAAVRKKEGLPPTTGVLHGTPPDTLAVHEDGRRYLVDVATGHKTGFYLDQRDNRSAVAAIARDRTVLDVCSFTGGFTMAALQGGAASVTAIDSSGPALAQAARTLEAAGWAERAEMVEADAFKELRRRQHLDGPRPDMIVLDPPKLAASQGQVDRATRAYKDLNLQAFRLLEPGGVLVTFSCSGAVDAALFQKVVFGAALDTGRDVQVIGRLTQASDHPVLLAFPEAEYLKGLVCLVV